MGLALCAKGAMKRIGVQVSLGRRSLELAVLELQLPQRLSFAGVHTAKLRMLRVEAGMAEAVLAANLLDRQPDPGLPEESNDLLFA